MRLQDVWPTFHQMSRNPKAAEDFCSGSLTAGTALPEGVDNKWVARGMYHRIRNPGG
jgi:hypothetical protein